MLCFASPGLFFLSLFSLSHTVRALFAPPPLIFYFFIFTGEKPRLLDSNLSLVALSSKIWGPFSVLGNTPAKLPHIPSCCPSLSSCPADASHEPWIGIPGQGRKFFPLSIIAYSILHHLYICPSVNCHVLPL